MNITEKIDNYLNEKVKCCSKCKKETKVLWQLADGKVCRDCWKKAKK